MSKKTSKKSSGKRKSKKASKQGKKIPSRSTKLPLMIIVVCLIGVGGYFFYDKYTQAKAPVIQSGNTLYYLYTAPMLAAVVEEARRGKLRLVYQGFIV